MAKTTKIRQSAQGQQCQVQLPGVCSLDNETTVLAHIALPGYSGTGMKPSDIHGTYACHACHDVMDGRSKTVLPKERVELLSLHGMYRTQALLVEAGLIKVPHVKDKKYLGEDTTQQWEEWLGV